MGDKQSKQVQLDETRSNKGGRETKTTQNQKYSPNIERTTKNVEPLESEPNIRTNQKSDHNISRSNVSEPHAKSQEKTIRKESEVYSPQQNHVGNIQIQPICTDKDQIPVEQVSLKVYNTESVKGKTNCENHSHTSDTTNIPGNVVISHSYHESCTKYTEAKESHNGVDMETNKERVDKENHTTSYARNYRSAGHTRQNKTQNNFQQEFKLAMKQKLISDVEELQQSNRDILKRMDDSKRPHRAVDEYHLTRIEDSIERLKVQEMRSQEKDEEINVLSQAVDVISQNVDRLCNTLKEKQRHLSQTKRVESSNGCEYTSNIRSGKVIQRKQLKRNENASSDQETHKSSLRKGFPETDMELLKEVPETDMPLHKEVPETDLDREKMKRDVESSVTKIQQCSIPNVQETKVQMDELGFKRRVTRQNEDNRVWCLEHEIPTRNVASGVPQTQIPNITRQGTTEGQSGTDDSSSRLNTQTPADGGNIVSERQHIKDTMEKLATMRTGNGNEYRNLVANPSGLAQELIDGNLWAEWAQEELDRAKTLPKTREKGPDTVLCLDISASMEGEPFRQMVKLAKTFVSEIENISRTIGVRENVSLVTFGHETRVVKHMCSDYRRIIAYIDKLHPDGPSPLGGGLLMALAGALGHGSVTTFLDVDVAPRIIVISDGKATPDSILTGPDEEPDAVGRFQVQLKLGAVLHYLKRRGNRVFCVPVGKPNVVNLELLTSITNGKMIPPNKLPYLIWMYRNFAIAMQIKNEYLANSLDDAALLSSISNLMPDFTPDDVEAILEFAKNPKILAHELTDALESGSTLKEIPGSNMPPIGTRVRRGADWMWKDQDLNGPGTIIGHQQEGVVYVAWDKINRNNVYRYGVNGAFDLVICDEPRILKSDELIATGCAVKRGPDWKWEDQDGGDGNIGYVYRVEINGWIGVRWPNGKTFNCRYGAEESFDLTICGENELMQTKPTPQSASVLRKSSASSAVKAKSMEKGHIIDTSPPSVDEMNKRNTSRLNMRTDGAESGGGPKKDRKQIASHPVNSEKTMIKKSKNRGIEPDKPSVRKAVLDKSDKPCSSISDGKDTLEEKKSHIKTEETHGSKPFVGEHVEQGSEKNTFRKSVYKNENANYQESKSNVIWSFKGENEWLNYPKDVSDKMETAYTRKPTGTTVIQLDQQIFRIQFSKMIQVDIGTREIKAITRTDEQAGYVNDKVMDDV